MHRRALRRLMTSPWTAGSLLVLGLVVFAALLDRHILPFDPTRQELMLRLRPPGFRDVQGNLHLFGTDRLGRDIFGLVIAGARPALLVSLGSVSISVVLGVAAGLTAGYWEGFWASLLMRLADIQLSFPFFLLAIAIVGIVGPSLPLVLLIIGLGNWAPYARVVRAEVMQLKTQEYVLAARAVGARDGYIVRRHIAPHSLPSILVLVSFNLATAILMEAGLSFLGLGAPAGTPTWGRMLSEGRDYVATAWWLPLFPGLAIFLLALAINLIGDVLREVLDPKLRS